MKTENPPSSYIGIDYGLGKCNVDARNGVRYGIIDADSAEFLSEELEPEFCDVCPACGWAAEDNVLPFAKLDKVKKDHALDEGSCYDISNEVGQPDDSVCTNCLTFYRPGQLERANDGLDVDSLVLNKGGYVGTLGEHGDLFLTQSPYYTRCVFCSPCAPGAGDLNNPHPDGVRTYCLGHDYFTGGRAPYPVYSVETNQEVYP